MKYGKTLANVVAVEKAKFNFKLNDYSVYCPNPTKGNPLMTPKVLIQQKPNNYFAVEIRAFFDYAAALPVLYGVVIVESKEANFAISDVLTTIRQKDFIKNLWLNNFEFSSGDLGFEVTNLYIDGLVPGVRYLGQLDNTDNPVSYYTLCGLNFNFLCAARPNKAALLLVEAIHSQHCATNANPSIRRATLDYKEAKAKLWRMSK